ncbi:hypothetical protein B0H14DRAFT_3528745 [Mycena olivaceomarginata]|nr:hypothetical protein B0H14DRAFT_3528745 [Mycena olivaceomarginata]
MDYSSIIWSPYFYSSLLVPALRCPSCHFKVKVWSEINNFRFRPPSGSDHGIDGHSHWGDCVRKLSCAPGLLCHAPTRSALTTLICLSIQTSFCTAACAAINLIVYLTLPGTLYHLLLQFSMCRVYTIMVLFTLLQRDGLRKKLDEQAIYDISLVVFDPQYNNSLKPDDASVEYI